MTEDSAKRIVVFGSTGKIGGELVKLLARDPRCAEVIALSRRPDGDKGRWLAAVSPTVTVRAFDASRLGPACQGATDAFVVAPLDGGVGPAFLGGLRTEGGVVEVSERVLRRAARRWSMRFAWVWFGLSLGGCLSEERSCEIVQNYVEDNAPAFRDASQVEGVSSLSFEGCRGFLIDRSEGFVEVEAALTLTGSEGDAARVVGCELARYDNGWVVVGCWFQCDPVVGVCSLAQHGGDVAE